MSVRNLIPWGRGGSAPNAARIRRGFASETKPPIVLGPSTSFDFHHSASRLAGVTGTGFSTVTGAA